MHVRRFATQIEVITPAKINLFLEVLAKRPDGYHEIETLITAVSLYDSLTFKPISDRRISLDCRWALGAAASERPPTPSAAHELLYNVIPSGPENLVWRAVKLLQERSGVQQGASIELVKRIPAAAGLGGASSDAAATLVAANIAWKLNWPVARLIEVAAELGSDIPFFLTRWVAVCRGRGERMESLAPPRLHAVMVRPPVGLSTPQVYKRCKPADQPQAIEPLAEALQRGDAAAVGRNLHNRLQAPAAELTPWMDRLQKEFGKQDVVGQQMSGSGSSYFGLCRSARQARRVAARLRARNVGAVFAATTAVAG